MRLETQSCNFRSTRWFITGVNGQDGSFLAELVLRCGGEVIGVGRDASSRWVPAQARFKYIQLDILDRSGLFEVLRNVQPNFIVHAAAVHGASRFDYSAIWDQAYDVNTLVPLGFLEYAKAHSNVGLIFFSSVKIFVGDVNRVVNEDSEKAVTCLYSACKLHLHDLVSLYRREWGVKAQVLIAYNHESERRKSGFFFDVIAQALVVAKRGGGAMSEVRALDFISDWGSARDLASAILELVSRDCFEDFIFATGKLTNARHLVKKLFADFNLDYEEHLRVLEPGTEPTKAVPTPDITKLSNRLGWRPARDPVCILHEIVDYKFFIQ